jgi:hypothetical protein
MTGLVVVALLVVVVLPAGVISFVQRNLRVTTSPAQIRARRLVEKGTRARATLLRIEPTGTVVNPVTLQCVLQFQIQPLDGSAPFAGTRTMVVSRQAMPRAGDVWPAWFDPAAPTQFAVGMPDGDAEDLIPLYREFGIRHPLDSAPATA